MRKGPAMDLAARGPAVGRRPAGKGACAVFLALFPVLILALAEPALADFAAGAKAYGRGDYEAAIAAWQPLAEAGNARAQYNLGLMTVQGLGRAPDPAAAAVWLLAAARQGHGGAQLTLGLLYGLGEGVPRDLVKAHVWLDRAVGNLPAGRDRDEALRQRDLVKAEMGQRQFEQSLRVAVVPGGPDDPVPGTAEMPSFAPLPQAPPPGTEAETIAVAKAEPPAAEPPAAETPGETAHPFKTTKDERTAALFTLTLSDLIGDDDDAPLPTAAKPADAEASDAETADAEPANAEPANAEPVNAETSEAGPRDGEPADTAKDQAAVSDGEPAAPKAVAPPAEVAPAAQLAVQPSAQPALQSIASAAAVMVRAGRHGDFARIVFDWPGPVRYAARLEGGRLLVFFSEPGDFELGAVARHLGGYLGPGEVSADGTTVGFTLAQALEIKAFTLDNRIVIDLTPTP